MENEKVFCVRCNLSIEQQKHIRILRKPRGGENPNVQYWAYWHNRYQGDCWSKTVAEAKARKEAALSQAVKNGKGQQHFEFYGTSKENAEYTKWLASREGRVIQ